MREHRVQTIAPSRAGQITSGEVFLPSERFQFAVRTAQLKAQCCERRKNHGAFEFGVSSVPVVFILDRRSRSMCSWRYACVDGQMTVGKPVDAGDFHEHRNRRAATDTCASYHHRTAKESP